MADQVATTQALRLVRSIRLLHREERAQRRRAAEAAILDFRVCRGTTVTIDPGFAEAFLADGHGRAAA